ncbi:MAG TPA: DEAD/DEAH box helicase [candidate division Zixibacteria bacterium]|nr:DEAD/DEAH box helicase [candidate division Zixibacteria bacterium]
MIKNIDTVAKNAIVHFDKIIHPKAIRIFTPFTKSTPLNSCKISPLMKKFIIKYEPKVLTNGLFPHQAKFLKAYLEEGKENFIITTATGSGKSLCFWTWIFHKLLQDTETTAILCFPTQALMWSQAKRLEDLSEKKIFPGKQRNIAYGGTIKIGNQAIEWTVWHGIGKDYTRDPVMAEHEKSGAFRSARIRVATLDKAHFSLIGMHKDFTSNLQCVVIDEAHAYDGVFGANVHYFLKRLYLASEILGNKRPGIFLASATLSSARKFSKDLLSLENEKEITHIEDLTKQRIDLISLKDVQKQLASPPADGLLRIVLLLDNQLDDVSLLPFMGSEKELGTEVNTICFSQSRLHGKLLAGDLKKSSKKRQIIIYDATLPPVRRRELEKEMNGSTIRGITIVATNALELGVDIEGLDICFIDKVPPRRADLLQRIGRVGRRMNRPGLVLMRLSSEPLDQSILEDPVEVFRLDMARQIPIPLHLEMLKWRHMLAAFSEWHWTLKSRKVDWKDFNNALHNNFGESPMYMDLKEQFEDRYGDLINMNDHFWEHKGFRAAASEGKIPLIEGDNEIARIEDTDVFRDAHPEAVFLGHDLNRHRVVDYDGSWKIAEWSHPGSDILLGKWLRSISKIWVVREKRRITTVGAWDEEFDLFERIPDLPKYLEYPNNGFEFGIWNYIRKWQGYTEIDLKTNGKRKVSLKEVSERFKKAIDAGDNIPFLFPLTYRTLGWQWDFGKLKLTKTDLEWQKSLEILVEGILMHFFADAVESSLEDIRVDLNLSKHLLQVLDTTPGGNGLSEALLSEGRMVKALKKFEVTLSKFEGKENKDKFVKYVLALCHIVPENSAKEVLNVVRELNMHWIR